MSFSKNGHAEASFPIKDFCSKWKKSRLGVLSSYLPESSISDLGDSICIDRQGYSYEDERALLGRIDDDLYEYLLRSLFQESKFVGAHFRDFRLPGGSKDLAALFQEVPLPCFEGQWRTVGRCASCINDRGNCDKNPGTIWCSYWKIAIQGLLEGLHSEWDVQQTVHIGSVDLCAFKFKKRFDAALVNWY